MSSFVVDDMNTKKSSRTFTDGSERWVVVLASACIGKGIYKPGWRWSEHAGPESARPSMSHIGYVESGRMMIRSSDGVEFEVGPGSAFEVGPNHDAWVIGNEPCVALDFERVHPRSS